MIQLTKGAFRESFLRHFEESDLNMAEVARRTGVSKFKLDSLKEGRSKTTSVEDAVKIAAFFGRPVEEFCRAAVDPERAKLLKHINALSPDDLRTMEAQIKGLVALRGP